MPEITRDNHFVPQGALRRWSANGTHVYEYRTLVSHPEVPTWSPRALRAVARQTNLYTGFDGNRQVDRFEREIGQRYEDPGLAGIAKLIDGGQVTPGEWRSIIKFVALQDFRTPQAFHEAIDRFNHHLPAALQHAVEEAERVFGKIGRSKEQRKAEMAQELAAESPVNAFRDSLRVHITPPEDGSNLAAVSVDVRSARSVWMDSVASLMDGSAVGTLCAQRWSVAEAASGLEWPMTDHPVVRLNYYGTANYDLKGGYGNPNSEIVMPISPRYLLYVKIGSKSRNRFQFTTDETQLVQRVLVERARRAVFLRSPAEWVEKLRPREVNADKFKAEQGLWARLHAEHVAEEADFHHRAASPKTRPPSQA